MRSCRADPFYFRSWESTVAWAVCYTTGDLGICSSGSLAVPYFPRIQVCPRPPPLRDPFYTTPRHKIAHARAREKVSRPCTQEAATNFSMVIGKARATGDFDEMRAFSFCFLITLAQAVPWFILVGAGLYIVLALATVPLILASNLVQALVQFIAYSHLPDGEDTGAGP